MSRRRKRSGAADGEWEIARRLCGLSARQLDMARKLGMNPKKLPGLRPSPSQKWKLPVGEFIEECFRKRFGEVADEERVARTVAPRQPAPPEIPSRDAHPLLEALAIFLANLSDDVGAWLSHGAISPGLPARIGAELRDVAERLVRGGSIPPWPTIDRPDIPEELERASGERALDDDDSVDDIPF